MRKRITKLRSEIVDILRESDVKKASIFGSFARGTEKKNSDVDLLIEFKGNKSLLDLSRLKLSLEDRTKQKFDVLTYKSINPKLKKQILKDEVKIL